MKRSTDRILTTHVGRLQRLEALTAAMEAHPRGQPTDPAFAAQLKTGGRRDRPRAAGESGIDIVNDGEFGKLNWNVYLNGRMGGHEMVPIEPGAAPARRSRDREEFAQFYAELESGGSYYYRSPGRNAPAGMRWACTGPVTYAGRDALKQDLDHLAAALAAVKVVEAFIPATSPIRPHTNAYYKTEDEYYDAVGEAMRTEYKAIVDAGFVLQIDDPHLPDLWEVRRRLPSMPGIPWSAPRASSKS